MTPERFARTHTARSGGTCEECGTHAPVLFQTALRDVCLACGPYVERMARGVRRYAARGARMRAQWDRTHARRGWWSVNTTENGGRS